MSLLNLINFSATIWIIMISMVPDRKLSQKSQSATQSVSVTFLAPKTECLTSANLNTIVCTTETSLQKNIGRVDARVLTLSIQNTVSEIRSKMEIFSRWQKLAWITDTAILIKIFHAPYPHPCQGSAILKLKTLRVAKLTQRCSDHSPSIREDPIRLDP